MIETTHAQPSKLTFLEMYLTKHQRQKTALRSILKNTCLTLFATKITLNANCLLRYSHELIPSTSYFLKALPKISSYFLVCSEAILLAWKRVHYAIVLKVRALHNLGEESQLSPAELCPPGPVLLGPDQRLSFQACPIKICVKIIRSAGTFRAPCVEKETSENKFLEVNEELLWQIGPATHPNKVRDYCV